MKLESFFVSSLSYNELHRLCTEVVASVDEFFGSHDFLKQLRDQIEARAEDLRRSLDQDDRNELTQEIREADDQRDDAYRAIRAGVEFAVRHFDPKTQEAGELLSSLLAKYGQGMLEVGYGEQTTLADALLGVLAEPQNVQALKQTGLDGFVNQFQEKQDAFKELVRRRQDAEAADDLPPRRAIRAELHEHLMLTEAAIQFVLKIANPENKEVVARTINERTQEIVIPARARNTRKANASSTNDEPVADPVPLA